MKWTGLHRSGIGNWIFLVAAYNLFTCTQGGADPQSTLRFTHEPADVIVPHGGAVSLPCAVAAPPGARATLHWRHAADAPPGPGHTLPNSDATRILPNGTLHIERVLPSVAGFYQCVATHAVGTAVSRPARVSCAELPQVLGGPRSILLSPGDTALLPCGVRAAAGGAGGAVRVRGARPVERRTFRRSNAVPPPAVIVNVTWIKDGSPLRLDESRTTLLPSGALELAPLTVADGGRYRCRVALIGGTDYRDSPETELKVTESVEESAPRIVAPPQNLTVVEGVSLVLECGSAGRPAPQHQWLSNGKIVDLHDLDSRVYTVGSGSLGISAASPLDGGAYTCRAGNHIDSADATAWLTVMSVPRVSIPQGPVVLANKRGELTLSCQVKGRPLPSVSWLKDGEPLANQDRTSLHISGVLAVDAGIFQCIASNAAGRAQAAVRVVVTHTDASEIPRPLKKTAKHKHTHKQTFTHTTTQPDTHEIFTSLLSDEDSTLSSTDESLNYVGEISHAYTNDDFEYSEDFSPNAAEGMDLDAVTVNGSLVPTPKEFRAGIVKQRFVSLSWEVDEDVNVTGFAVVYRIQGSERERVVFVPGNKQETVISSLQPNCTYLFTVRAVKDMYASPPTEAIRVQTASLDSLSPAPGEVSAAARGARGVFVKWAPPAGGATEHIYTVLYTEEDSGREHSVTTTDTSVLLSGLRPGTTYRVWVSVAGGAAATATATTEVAPPGVAPANVMAQAQGANSILVWWSGGGGKTGAPLTGYKVRYRASGAASPPASPPPPPHTLATPADTTRVVIRDLMPDTNYQVRVLALNSVGAGPPSEWVSVSTAPRAAARAPPPPPKHLNTRAGRDWISVWWSWSSSQLSPEAGGAGGAGGAAGGAAGARGFELGWGRGVPDDHSKSLAANQQSTVLRDLEPNSEYVISVRARNSLGLGPPVYATVRTLAEAGAEEEELEEDEEEEEEGEEEPLIPPVGLKAIMLSGTTAVVYWTDPTLPKGQPVLDGRSYVVRWSGGGKTKTHNVTDLSCMVDDLRPHTKYEFSVKLIKGGRESAYSMVVRNTSLPAAPSPPRALTAAAAGTLALALSWQPPNRHNGPLTGYVVTYSVADGPWQSLRVSTTNARLDRLRPNTLYRLAVQASNAAGLSQPSQQITYTTGPAVEGESSRGLAGATAAWLWASAGGAAAVLALAAALALALHCRGRAHTPDYPSTYQKASATAGLKPPDLWIHHDQMELKHIDKGMHSSASKISAGSVDGCTVGTLASSSCQYEPTRPAAAAAASLDRRHYVATYVDRRWSRDSSETAALRSESPQHSYNDYVPPMGGPGCASTCDRRMRLPPLTDMHGGGGGGGGGVSPQSSLASLGVLHALPPPAPCGSGSCPLGSACTPRPSLHHSTGCPGAGVPPQPAIQGVMGPLTGDVYATAGRGQYVAYEPLGRYAQSESSTVEAGSGSPGRRLRSFDAGAHTPSSTPEHHRGSVREASPYKKSSSPGPCNNRLQLGRDSGRVSPSELQPLPVSGSSERLTRDLQSLEGLMRDLSCVTHHYRC